MLYKCVYRTFVDSVFQIKIARVEHIRQCVLYLANIKCFKYKCYLNTILQCSY